MASSTRVRLIFTDSSLDCGQRVKTVSDRFTSIDSVVSNLNAYFSFEDFCDKRGIQRTELFNGGLIVVGIDGPRRVPLQTQDDFSAFFQSIGNTQLPSLEVQLARKPPTPKTPVGGQRKAGRDPRDRTEQLEDDNFKLLAASQRTDRRLDELDRVLATLKEENARAIEIATRKLAQTQEEALKSFQQQLDALKEADKSMLDDLDVVRKHGQKLEAKQTKDQQDFDKRIQVMDDDIQEQFQGIGLKLHELATADEEMKAELKAEDERLAQMLSEHAETHRQDVARLDDEEAKNVARLEDEQAKNVARLEAELARLDRVKVDKEVWQDYKDKMNDYCKKEFGNLNAKVDEAENRLRGEQKEASLGHKADHTGLTEATATADKALEEALNAAKSDLDSKLTKLQEALKTGLADAQKSTEQKSKEVLSKADAKIQALTDDTQARFDSTHRDVKEKDKAINTRVEELTIKSEKTFTGLNERLEEMVRIERARLAALETEFTQNVARIQSDLRAEIERLRDDHDQEAARLDADLGDLHMKHDVTKQEINFFQSRLQEQREWAQGQLAESATAVKAAQVDAQEGLAAATKMLHALRDDAVGFREKMAKYISLLQHSSDSHGDAIQSLESQRARIRTDLDVLVGDHKAYTADMDGWADDVRVKVERIFRALEPPRVEWRICRASQRAKEMKRPLAVKSPTFTLKGLRQVQMEFFPDGHNNAPEGKAILRLFFPPNAHMRFQCSLGRASLGSHEFKPGGSLSCDVQVDAWKDQIQDDGAIAIIVEVLRDFNSDDESLSREVRVESP